MTAPDYARAFDAAPAPLLLLTADLRVVRAGREWLAALAPAVHSAEGRLLEDVLRPRPDDPEADGTAALLAGLIRARDTGRPDDPPAQRFDVALPDGGFQERWWRYRTVPILDEGGDVVLLVHRADDATGRPDPNSTPSGTAELERANAELRALGERQRRTAETLTGLATTVSALAGAENGADLLTLLFRHGRPALRADLLAVALLEPGGAQLAVVDTRNPSNDEPRRVPARSPLPMAVAATGQQVLRADAVDDPTSGPPFPGLRAWAALPLRIGRRPLGSVLVGWNAAQEFGDDDVRVLEAFAAQCSEALARVTRLEAERRRGNATRGLAETLQRSLLTDPPRQPQFDIAVRYRPAAREARIGGDWYDAFVSAPGETTLVVGDVTGHDWTAAAIAGQLRSMLRGITAALDREDLGRVLATLDRALRDTGLGTLASALVARVVEPPAADPERPRTLRWSNAGHPPPLLVEADGTAVLLERPTNPLLGVDPSSPRQEHAVDLRSGATLLLYTDGLVERRGESLDDGLARLLAIAGDLAVRPVPELCDEIIARLEPELIDDIALLALRVKVRGDAAT